MFVTFRGSLSFLLGAVVCCAFLRPGSSATDGRAKDCCVTPEQRRILDHMSLIHLPDGNGGRLPTIRFTRVNVQVVNGLGATNGHPADPASVDPAVTATNGVGNLIVGYNELGGFPADDRSGSHNLVVGAHNGYGSFGGQVVGHQNRVQGAYASVLGGRYNWASGAFASVSGGDSNEAHGQNASVRGGEHNLALGFAATVGGGFGNLATGDFSAVAGGQNNSAHGSSSCVSGGSLNVAGGDVSSISGGASNSAAGLFSTVGGGKDRSITGDGDWRAGDLFQED